MLMQAARPLGELENPSEFLPRHIGIGEADERHMLSVIGEASRRALIESIVPRSIARRQAMQLPAAVGEAQALAELKAKGMQVNELPAAEAARMRSNLTRVYASIGASVGMDLWNETQAELAKIRGAKK